MNNNLRTGRPCKPKRIKVNAVIIENGKQRHLFSVITTATTTDVIKALQFLRDHPDFQYIEGQPPLLIESL